MKTTMPPLVTLLAMVALLSPGCIENNGKESIDGNRNYAKTERETGDFHQIELKGDFEVELSRTSANKVTIEADSNLQNYIYTETKNGRLIISQPDNRRLKSLRQIKITVGASRVDHIEVYGRNRITSAGVFTFDSLRLEIYGASSVSLNIKGQYLSGIFPGAVDMMLEGNVPNVELQFPGAANLDAGKLTVQNFNLKMQGAGKASVFASHELNVDIAGAGLVNYYGNPTKVHSSIGGIGKLRRAD